MKRRLFALVIGLAAMGGGVLATNAGAQPTTYRVRDVAASADPLVAPDACPPGTAITATTTCSQADTELEPALAINPRDNRHLVAVMQLGRYAASGAAGVGFAVSRDGGAHWNDGMLPGLTLDAQGTYPKTSDPSVAFGPDGAVYVSADALPDTEGGPNGIATWRSFDDGNTWLGPVIVGGDNNSATANGINELNPDKSSLVVDPGTGPGHHFGRVYLTWFREGTVGPVLVAYSDDHAASWYAGTGVGCPVAGPGSAVPQPLVMPDGALTIVLQDSFTPLSGYPGATGGATDFGSALQDGLANGVGGNHIALYTDPTAGATRAGQPLLFTEVHGVGLEANGPVRQQRGGTENAFYSAAVDPTTGNLYLVWGDGRFRTDSVNDVVLTTSTDGGRTWSYPRAISAGGSVDELNSYDPQITVGQPTGDVYIAYRQRQEAADIHAASWQVHTLVQISADHGRSFSAPIQVDQDHTDLRYAATDCCGLTGDSSNAAAFLGDYFGLAATDTDVYVARTDPGAFDTSDPATFPPTFHHQRLYVANVSLPPAATRSAS